MPAHALDHDRRAYPRLPVTLRLRAIHEGGGFTAYTTDVSLGSSFVQTPRRLAPGVTVQLEVALSHGGRVQPVTIEALVVREQDPRRGARPGLPTGFAVRFTDVPLGYRAWSAWIRQMLADHASPSAGADRRRARRVHVGVPLRWGTTDPPRARGYLSDLSASGCFVVETDRPVEAGHRIYMHFDLPVDDEIRTVRAIATVVRLAPGDTSVAGMGIAFDLASIGIEDVERFVRSRCALEDARATAEFPPHG